MRIAILNTDYPRVISWLYGTNPGLEGEPFQTQMRVRVQSLFGLADFYSHNLGQLGHEGTEIFVNNEALQRAWAREQGLDHLAVGSRRLGRRMADRLMTMVTGTQRGSWMWDVLRAQLEEFRPDVILNLAMDGIPAQFFHQIKKRRIAIVGQHSASQIDTNQDFTCYDLVLSSFPPTVRLFGDKGIRARLHRLAFEPSVISEIHQAERDLDVTFVGSLYSIHESRRKFLEGVAARVPQLKIWGPDDETLTSSALRANYVGEAWGRPMYSVIARSKITLNHHGDIAPHANNSRLYEATGMGALLITDWKPDLSQLFRPGTEVVSYGSVDECADLIGHFLEAETERQAIAEAGQARTLSTHTLGLRVKELLSFIGEMAP